MAMNGYHDNREMEEERGLEDMIKLEYEFLFFFLKKTLSDTY